MDPELLTKVYDFPPLFTLQPNQSSKRKQLGIWRDILRSHDLFILTNHSEIFHNKRIKRSFDPCAVGELCAFLVTENLGEWLVPEDKFLFYQTPLVVWGDKLSTWMSDTGRTNTVETLFSISNEWKPEQRQIPIELVYRACKYLEKEKKCEVFTDGDTDSAVSLDLVGVKFF
jgi:ESCRT-II complex subunit VPS25